MEKFLICLDPDSRQFFSLNTNTNDVIVQTHVPADVRKKAEKALDELETLLGKITPWNMETEKTDSYRRRQIPSYLLQNLSSPYPTYLCQSTLSLAFEKVNTVKLIVSLEEYGDFIEKNQIQDNIQDLNLKRDSVQGQLNLNGFQENQQKSDFNQSRLQIEIEAALVTGIKQSSYLCFRADQVIRNVLRETMKIFSVQLQPKDNNHQFILQISGQRQYLTGNYPMLSYDRVRMNLRGLDGLKVVLTEMLKKDPVQALFPPVYERSSKELNQGIISTIEWNKFKNVPFLFWYPFIKLQKYAQTEQENNEIFQTLKKKYLFYNDYIRISQISDAKSIKYKTNYLISGQCDCQFKIKVIGINALQMIFQSTHKSLHERSAINNGILPLQFVTMKYQSQGHHVKAQSVSQQEKEEELAKVLGYSPNECLPKIVQFKENRSKSNSNNVNNGSLASNLKEGSMKISAGGQRENFDHVIVIDKEQQREPLIKDFFTPFFDLGREGTEYLIEFTKYFNLDFVPYLIAVEVKLLHGSNTISRVMTPMIPFSFLPVWSEWINFPDIKYSQLLKEMRILFSIFIFNQEVTDQLVIGSTSFEIFSEHSRFNSGMHHVKIWPFYALQERISCVGEFNGMTDAKGNVIQNFSNITFALQDFNLPMFSSIRDNYIMQEKYGFPQINEESNESEWNLKPQTEDLANLQFLLNSDPLSRMNFTSEQKKILMKSRNYYQSLPEALQIFLESVDWKNPTHVLETHQMLLQWSPPHPYDALPLLNANHADQLVRLYAVERVSTMSDDEISLFILEFVQILQYELRHKSAIGEFLLERAIQNPYIVGHDLFWQLREQFLMMCGSYRNQLLNELQLNENLTQIALEVNKQGSNIDEKQKVLGEELLKIKQNDQAKALTFALDSRYQGSEFIIDQCQVLDSKKLPLWLEIQNSLTLKKHGYISKESLGRNTLNQDGESIQKEGNSSSDDVIKIIFKCGDDIRQDQLTLQLLQIMDKFWLDNNEDFRMKPYRVISTADQVGMIEVVANSQTTSHIHVSQGGTFGALRKNTIEKFLNQHNSQPDDIQRAIENFYYSCAGYCVATYILGVGDRHSGNIMLTRSGHLFHIDFGHFLGNFKTKYGINRERAKFVFTEEMAFVMGGQDGDEFQLFQDYCTKAYNIVRQHGHFLINVFLLMLSAGITELNEIQDIQYLKNMLALDLSQQQATSQFKQEIQESLNSSWRRIDNFIHNMRRNG